MLARLPAAMQAVRDIHVTRVSVQATLLLTAAVHRYHGKGYPLAGDEWPQGIELKYGSASV